MPNGSWNLPYSFQCVYPEVTQRILSTILPINNVPNKVVWATSSFGNLCSADAYKSICLNFSKVVWGKHFWHTALQPCKSLATWKIIQKRVFTDDRLQRMKVQLCSRCYLCLSSVETSSHLFMHCPIVASLWNWIFSMFRLLIPHGTTLHDLFLDDHLVSLSHSSKLMWYISVCNLLWCVWSEQNMRRHEACICCLVALKQFFIRSLRESAAIAFSPHANSIPIFGFLGLSPLRPKASRFILVVWDPPLAD